MKVISKTNFTKQQGLFDESTLLVRGDASKQQGAFDEQTLLLRRNVAAFTLLEVIAGLAIMMLLIGGVYGIANGALDLGVKSSEARKIAVREMNFSNVIRNTFEKLGPEVKITISPSRLNLSGQQGVFDMGGQTGLADVVTFEFRQDDGALWVSHFRQNSQVSELRLLGDLLGLFWECQDPVSGNWVRSWNVTGDLRPELIRLRLIRGEAEETDVFWIPNYQKEASQ